MDIKVKTDFGRKILIEKSRTCQDAYMVKHSWTSSYAKKLCLKKFDIGKLLIFCRRGLNWTFHSIPFFCMARNFYGNLLKFFALKVAKRNSVQIHPNFPAKSLSIYAKFFPVLLLINNYLINLQLERTNNK